MSLGVVVLIKQNMSLQPVLLVLDLGLGP